MDRYRVKTIMIALLLIINIFLLVLVGTRGREAYRYEQAALDRTIQVLAKNGITMEPQAVVSRSGAGSRSTERSIPLEETAAAVLLGAGARSSNLGGGLYTYTSEMGEVSFRPGGEFSARLVDDPTWYTADPDGQAANLMSALAKENRLIRRDLTGGSGCVIYQQLVKKTPVFSCQVTFFYENGRLTQLSGRLLAVESVGSETGESLGLTTALMHFLDDILGSGDVCSAILQVEPGYLVGQSLTSAIQLRPVWYVSTNTADYYVDGINGSLNRIGET